MNSKLYPNSYLTLSDFKKWSSTALKALNNYIIKMTNNIDKIRGALSLLLISELIQQAALVHFILRFSF